MLSTTVTANILEFRSGKWAERIIKVRTQKLQSQTLKLEVSDFKSHAPLFGSSSDHSTASVPSFCAFILKTKKIERLYIIYIHSNKEMTLKGDRKDTQR